MEAEEDLPPYVAPGTLGGVDVDEPEPAEPLEPEPDPHPNGTTSLPDPGDPPPGFVPPKPSGSPSRTYIVLRQSEGDPDAEAAAGGDIGDWFRRIGTVDARNGENALRKAYADLTKGDRVKLVVIPESFWKEATVETKNRPSISIT